MTVEEEKDFAWRLVLTSVATQWRPDGIKIKSEDRM